MMENTDNMKWSITTLGLAATTTVLAIPQAARPDLEPKGTAPAGCKRTFEGDFRISVLRLNGNKKVSDGIAPPEIGNFTNVSIPFKKIVKLQANSSIPASTG